MLAADEESQAALPEELASLDGVAYLKLVPRLAAYASLRLDVGKPNPQISFVGQGVCVEQVCEMESIMKDITRVLQPFYTPQSSEPEPPWELKWNNDDQFLGKVYYALMTAEIPELLDVARHIINNSIKLGKFELEKGSKLVEATGLKNLIEGQDELDKDMILAAAKSKEAKNFKKWKEADLPLLDSVEDHAAKLLTTISDNDFFKDVNDAMGAYSQHLSGMVESAEATMASFVMAQALWRPLKDWCNRVSQSIKNRSRMKS